MYQFMVAIQVTPEVAKKIQDYGISFALGFDKGPEQMLKAGRTRLQCYKDPTENDINMCVGFQALAQIEMAGPPNHYIEDTTTNPS